MIGTFVNVACILVGSLLGSTLKKTFPKHIQSVLFDAMGLVAIALAINTITANMPNSQHPVLFIAALAIGGILGSLVNIDKRISTFIDTRSKTPLARGLTTACLLFCIGSLSILGPINSALFNDHTFLFTNATLDLITSMVLSTTYGIGIAYSAGILLLWQGSIYLSAQFLYPFLTPEVMCEISILGGILILASGLSILKIKEIKTINLLPSLLIVPLYFTILSFF